MLGAAEEWFYRRLGGIDVDLSRKVQEERMTIRPIAVQGVDWVRCGFESALGKVESDWKRNGGVVRYTVTVPVASTVVLPEGAVAAGNGVAQLHSGHGQSVFRVRHGTWRFIIRQP